MNVPIYFFSFSCNCNAFCLVYVLLFTLWLMIGGLCINMVKIFAYGIYALIRPPGYVNLKNEASLKLLLYGDDDLPNSLNRHILELTHNFTHETGRFK